MHSTREGHIDKTLANRMKKGGRRWSKRRADSMARVIAATRSGRPLPVGTWNEPVPAAGSRPCAVAAASQSTHPTPAWVTPAGIVLHARGRRFTKTLHEIAGAGHTG